MNWRKMLLFVVVAGVGIGAWAEQPLRPTTLTPLKFDVSPPLRDIEAVKQVEAPVAPENPAPVKGQPLGPVVDPVVQTWGGKENMPAPIVNFEAIKNDFGV